MVHGIDGIDLKCDRAGRGVDGRARSGSHRDDGARRRLDESIVHRKNERVAVGHERDATNCSLSQEAQTGLV
jgi:hypothetical protein